MKKKVLIAITKSNWGGAQRYVFNIATSISKAEYDVAVMHGGDGIMAEKLRGSGIRTMEIPGLARDISVFVDVSVFTSLLRMLRSERPDVLHLNSSKMGLLGALAGRLAGVPCIVFTAHGWAFNEDRSFLQKTLLRVFAYFTIMLSHRTIAISDAVADAIRMPLIRKRLAVVKNGVTAAEYKERSDARTSLVQHSSEQEFWFGTIAELHPVKGLRYAVEAFTSHAAHFPTAHYVILGEGESRTELESLVQQSSYAERIHVVGFRDEAPQYLKAFDVFVLPSLSEGLSLAILEAGLARIPVIATNVGGIPEIIRNNEQGVLVSPRNSVGLSEAFARLQTDPRLRESIAAALYERVTHEYSLEKMVRKTTALYRCRE